MGTILALDYGKKRTGIAITDPLQIIASGLETVETAKLMDRLAQLIEREQVEELVVGQPVRMNDEPSAIEADIVRFIKSFSKRFPKVKVHREDERFTSKMAMEAMVAGGVKKKKRRDKALVDKVSATLILQSYLENRTTKS